MSRSGTRNFLMVCTGNHCRSPMAEVLAADWAEAHGEDWDVRSAGIGALVGVPAAAGAREAVKEWGLDLSEFRGAQLTVEHMAWADHVIVMEPVHKAVAEDLAPEHAHKIILLLDGGVPDPLGGNTDRFRSSRDQLAELLAELLPSVQGRGGAAND